MNADLVELVADVRRRCRAADREEARAIANLPDQDLLWLVANGWQPPADAPARSASSRGRNAFVLTTAQYEEYKAAVAGAQQIRWQLVATPRDSPRVAELRLKLQRAAEDIRALSDQWTVER